MSDLNTEEATEETSDFPEWMAQLPSEYKKDEYGKPYKTMGEFYKTHKGLKAKLDSIPKAPEKPEGYEFPEDETTNKDLLKWFRKTVHSLKVPKDHAEKLYVQWNEYAAGEIAKRTKEQENALVKLDELMHGEWGADYDKNMGYVDKAIEDLGGEDLKKALDETGAKNNPVILKALKQIGFEHSDDTLREGVVAGVTKKRSLDDEYPSMKGIPDRQ